MALLEHKARTSSTDTLFIFDEPDTHLHVKAQSELMDIIDRISMNSGQVILTTHSPFIMNAAHPSQVRLIERQRESSSIKMLNKKHKPDDLLINLGIENLHIFFSRYIFIVEGESEEIFVPAAYQKIFSRPIQRDFIKVVRRPGITDVPRFVEVLKDFVNPERIIVLVDNDGDRKTNEILDEFEKNSLSSQIYRVGNKEFEDSFRVEDVYISWKTYLEVNRKSIGPQWTEENIAREHKRCLREEDKFSKSLSRLNSQGGEKLKKPTLAHALATYTDVEHYPKQIVEALRFVRGCEG